MNVYFLNPGNKGHSEYLTERKRYKLQTKQFKNMTATIIDDEGDVIRIVLDGYVSPEYMEGCYHLYYHNMWILESEMENHG